MAVARQGPRGTTAAVEKQHGQAAGSGERHDSWGCAASCGGGRGKGGTSWLQQKQQQSRAAAASNARIDAMPTPSSSWEGQARCSRSWKAPPTAGRRLAGAPLNARCADGKTVEKARSSVDAANDAGIRLLPMIPLGYSTRTIHYQYHPYHAACHCQRITPPSLLLQGGRELEGCEQGTCLGPLKHLWQASGRPLASAVALTPHRQTQPPRHLVWCSPGATLYTPHASA